MIEEVRVNEGSFISQDGNLPPGSPSRGSKGSRSPQRLRKKKRPKQFFSYRNLRKLSDKLDSAKRSAEWIKEYEENVSGLFKKEE